MFFRRSDSWSRPVKLAESLESRRLLASTTLAPLADLYVRDGSSAASNFGAAPLVVVKGSTTVGNSRQAFLKFDASGISDTIDNVTLRLFGSSTASTPSVSLGTFGVGDATWSEVGINWNNKPDLAGGAISTRSVSSTTDQWYEWDVTSFVKSEIAAGRTTVALSLAPMTSSTANPTAEFASRESASDPQLVVTTSSEPDPDPDPNPTAVLRVDAGAGPFIDSAGHVWAADSGFVGGGPNAGIFSVAGTVDDALYATRRTGTFIYSNLVPDGDYTLNLLFADYYSPGLRKFNVSIEGQQVLTNFDISAEAGKNTALVKSFPVTISDGTFDMNFAAVLGFASLSAFELLANSGGEPPLPPELPTLSIDDVSLNEGNSGLSPLTFTVTRAGDTSSVSTVAWATQNGTGGEGDYAVASGAISFAAGQTSKPIIINLKGDTKIEGDETFFVNLSSANGATISDAKGQGTILNDDVPGTNIGNITWTRNGPRSPVPRTEAGVIQIGSKVYAIGGFTAEGGTGTFFPLTRRVHVYDMADKTWSELASLPSQAPGNHSGIATDGSNIYVVAGQVGDTYGAGTNTAWKYDIANNQWTSFPSLPEVRFGGGAFVVNGWLHYVAGDQADRETPTDDHWAINLSDPNGGWIRKASILQPGDHATHAELNGKIYFFGGEHGHHGLGPNDENGYVQHDYVFAYDPLTDQWTQKNNMPLGFSHAEGTTVVINGKAIFIGGLLTGGDPNISNRVYVYSPNNDSWSLLSTRFPKRVDGATSGYWNGKLYVTDGYSPDENDRQVGFDGSVVFT